MDPTPVCLRSLPRRHGDTTSWIWVHCLNDWDQAGHYSWGSTVLCFLYRQLCKRCRRSSSNPSLGGCVYLLQLWMWARLPVGRPEVLARREWFQSQPLSRQPTWVYLWAQVRVPYARLDRAYIEFMNELDTLTTSSVSKFYFPCWFEKD